MTQYLRVISKNVSYFLTGTSEETKSLESTLIFHGLSNGRSYFKKLIFCMPVYIYFGRFSHGRSHNKEYLKKSNVHIELIYVV
jgi:hypothetical protein